MENQGLSPRLWLATAIDVKEREVEKNPETKADAAKIINIYKKALNAYEHSNKEITLTSKTGLLSSDDIHITYNQKASAFKIENTNNIKSKYEEAFSPEMHKKVAWMDKLIPKQISLSDTNKEIAELQADMRVFGEGPQGRLSLIELRTKKIALEAEIRTIQDRLDQ